MYVCMYNKCAYIFQIYISFVNHPRTSGVFLKPPKKLLSTQVHKLE